MNSWVRIQNSELNGLSRFQENGFQIIPSLVSLEDCDRLATELTPLFEAHIKNSKSRIGGVRNLLRTNSLVASFAKSSAILDLIQQVATKPAFPVRAIFFDKNPESNWLVPWHQDLAVAVEKEIATPGFSGWSRIDGTLHVHPPQGILAGMVTLRLHLDDCDSSNGALKLIVGSHHAGKIPSAEIARWQTQSDPVMCEISKGGALLMSPLLLHASSPAEAPRHRRVLHIEYATEQLPNGLTWFDN